MDCNPLLAFLSNNSTASAAESRAKGVEGAEKGVVVEPHVLEHARDRQAGLGEGEQVVLGAKVLVLEAGHFRRGRSHHRGEVARGRRGRGRALQGGASVQLCGELLLEGRQGNACVLEERFGNPLGLVKQRLQEMLVIDLRMAAARGVGEGCLKGLLELFGESFWCHMAATDAGGDAVV